jgi:hypothetical protein
LIQVFEEQLPGAEHRFCLRHLYANFKKKFGGGTLLRDLMMAAAKCTYFEAWEEKMAQIKAEKQEAYEWLMNIPTNKWCKHAFPFYSRCDVLMNNLSESFNATILLQRGKPIITMFEWIRTYLMARFATLREKVENYKGEIMSKPLRRLDREIEKSSNWTAIYAGRLSFQVTHVNMTDSFTVDLEKHSCSCNFWELVGIPCRPKKRPKTNDPVILPPEYKRGPGRPKKLRRREPDEANQPRWRRTNTTHRCNRCLEYGHNARTCKLPDPKKQTTNTEATVNTSLAIVPLNADNVQLPTQSSQTATATKKRVILKAY